MSYVFYCVASRLRIFYYGGKINLCGTIFNALSGLIGAIIGAGTSFFVTRMTLEKQYKKELELQEKRFQHEDTMWLREKRLTIYTELIDILEDFDIRLNALTYQDGIIETDNESVINLMQELREYIDNHKAVIFLFIKSERQKEIMILRSELFKFLNDKNAQNVEVQRINEAEITQLWIKTKEVSVHLKSDLGIK